MIDGEHVADLVISQPRLLADAVPWLPIGLWREVHASAPDGRYLDLHAPARTYPGSEIRLYVERGKPAIGVFRPRATDLPASLARIADQPIGALPGVQRIEIAIRARPAPPALELNVRGTAQTLPEHAELSKRRGAPLAALLAGVPGARVRVIGETTERVYARDVIESTPADFTLKRTHTGGFVFRRWQGTSATDELRGIRSIVVE